MIKRINDYRETVLEQFKRGSQVGEPSGLSFLDPHLKIRPGYFYTVTGWPGCFAKGQLIHTSTGVKPIDEVQKGDKVLSYNHEKQINEFANVTKTHIHKTTNQRLFKIKLKDGTEIKVTEDHEFYTGGKYVKIKDILLSLPYGKMEKNT